MKTVILLGLALAAAGCDRDEHRDADSRGASTAAADNTKKNERDRQPGAVTPMDQGENETDRTITQKIRQAVVKDDAFSLSAKNVKIITVDGVVTLRGPVKTEKEKTDIGAMAQQVANVKRVDNQLEIAPN